MLSIMKEANSDKLDNIKDLEWTADQLGISAVIIQDLSAHRNGDYRFDWSRMLSFQGETGPYLQYAHARICGIIRKVGGDLKLNKEANLDLLIEEEAFILAKLIGFYHRPLR